ncbi:thermonuclease family protein [Methylobacterium hispanicum]|uniref:thermonuclease family protein n=1 Tax=Methylobacterium hispanicum TaxID=270350 RepID=UPI002F35F29C
MTAGRRKRVSSVRLTLTVLGLLAAPALAAEPITGRPSVTDGDTLVIRNTRIRLHGIDAPESAQTCQDKAGKDYRCGQAAALALDSHIGHATVTCEPRDTDQYGRTVSVCRKGPEDLNAWMVTQEHAIAYRRYSTDYIAQEQAARAARRGIWAGTFEEPSTWRRAQRGATRENQPDPVPSHPALNCAIKGNISRSGEKVYHLPGSRDYARTVIKERAGERMFCSKDEARAAGWRAPRG